MRTSACHMRAEIREVWIPVSRLTHGDSAANHISASRAPTNSPVGQSIPIEGHSGEESRTADESRVNVQVLRVGQGLLASESPVRQGSLWIGWDGRGEALWVRG